MYIWKYRAFQSQVILWNPVSRFNHWINHVILIRSKLPTLTYLGTKHPTESTYLLTHECCWWRTPRPPLHISRMTLHLHSHWDQCISIRPTVKSFNSMSFLPFGEATPITSYPDSCYRHPSPHHPTFKIPLRLIRRPVLKFGFYLVHGEKVRVATFFTPFAVAVVGASVYVGGSAEGCPPGFITMRTRCWYSGAAGFAFAANMPV